ncbi:patatin-like phospholipase family protein [Nonomuraea guangzhouensis]|uniref:Patatin-like phospholipase family protein n=1 Tax=Nonomuraea guangzhouensis TaxID=1291555 RepID=A0ABW4G279_9ACTN|nr:patatin-like phospholipase family protein [Nonomuraea guangzhouensis]
MGRALVLGGGAVVGVAWEVGVLAGLAAKGVDLRDADLVVGTSAGALVGAQFAGGVDPEHLYGSQIAPPAGEPTPKVSPFGVFRLLWQLSRAKDAKDFGARMGRIALAARTVSEEERRSQIATWLGDVRDWPRTRLVITAVDAESGEPMDFDSGSGVDIVSAVSASTAAPGLRPPATVGGRRYIDGGMRSAANADLATGYDRVVVIAPMTQGGGRIMKGVKEQIAALGERSRVMLVEPDPKTWPSIAGRSMGNLVDPQRRAPAARAGRERGIELAAEVAAVWDG